MQLVPFWFIVITVLWTGFFILEGFDFGVGMLHGVVGQDEAGRRAAINTIGPLWDGNEVWLIVGAAAIFAAFPGWYATMFSGLYLALVLLLAALMARGIGLEYRGKTESMSWRRSFGGLLTGDYRIDDRSNVYLAQSIVTERDDSTYQGRFNNTVVGSRVKLSDQVSIYDEARDRKSVV